MKKLSYVIFYFIICIFFLAACQSSDPVNGSKNSEAEKILQEKEALVKDGKMKKIETPFGPVYQKQ